MPRRKLIPLLASLMVLAGCGVSTQVPSSASGARSSPAPSTGPTAAGSPSAQSADEWRTVHAGAMAVTIPSGWTAESPSPSPSSGQTTWVFAGSTGEVQLTASPLGSNSDQLLPMVFTPPGTGYHWGPSPYQGQIDLNGSITKEVLSASGTLYSIDVEGGPTRRLLASWRHPPIASVTQAVHLMEAATYQPSYTTVFANPTDGWILASGQPGAGQEAFYLFRTVNGGKTWSLERYTSPTGCVSQSPSCAFIAGDGWTGTAFWSGEDGIIVNASYLVAKAFIIRTTNGGQTWAAQTILLPASATGGHLRDQRGVLTLTLDQPGGHSPVTLESTDGGMAWSRAAGVSTPP